VTADGEATEPRPALRVVSGDATPEEIAAVVAAVAAAVPDADRAGSAGDEGSTSIWASPTWAHRQVPATFGPGPHAWRTSFWPR
jgi:Acyl-CoA carboxylase epsilon subunit